MYGEIMDITNSTQDSRPGTTDVQLHMAVWCVLRNENDVQVPATTVIKDSISDFDGRCVNNLVGIETGRKMVRLLS